MSRLDALKAAFAKKTTEVSSSFKRYLPFWKMQFDEQVVVRFLPDANQDNPRLFLIENLFHELWINGEKKRVPCLSMYDEDCPVCRKSQEFYKRDGDNSVEGKKYYKKREYIAQVLPVSVPFQTEDDEDPIKLVSFGPQIYKRIQSSIMSGDLDEDPSDLKNGYDFRITKTKQGENASYTDSSFVRKSTAVDPSLAESLNIKSLEEFRTKKMPVETIEQMLTAALNGAPVDTSSSAVTRVSAPASDTVTEAVQDVVTAPAATTAPAGGKSTADLLAQIRQRAAAQKSE